LPRIGGISYDRLVSYNRSLDFGVRFGALVSGLEISFPGNGDRLPQRLG
jgi:hypothetical protein